MFSSNTFHIINQELTFTDKVVTSDDYDENGQQISDDNMTEQFFKENTVSLEIGYSIFNVENTVSSPDQTFTEFVSSIGGLLGLVAGISFMTIYEFIEYPFIKLFSMFKSKQAHPEPQ